MKPTVLLLITMGVAITSFAGEKPRAERPKSVAAVNAFNKYDIAVSHAQIDFQRAMAAAEKILSSELDEALKISMKNGDLEEAKRIDAARKQMDSGLHVAGESDFAGAWTIIYTNGVVRHYIINANTVDFLEVKQLARVEWSNGGGFVDYGNGTFERLSVMRGKLFLEHFTAKEHIPDSPDFIGIGVKSKS